MSPRRAVNSFKFFSENSPNPQQHTQTPVFQALNSQPVSNRPNLAIAIPSSARQPKRASARNLISGGRDSIVTEFAEDGEGDDSAAGPGSALIWRPPNTDPQSATTYYVADKWGNWVLREAAEPVAELATPVSKTAGEREAELRQQQRLDVDTSEAVRAALTHLSSPTIPEAVALGIAGAGRKRAAPGRSTIRLVTPDSGRLPINSRGSSAYASYQAGRSAEPTPEEPLPTTASAEAFYADRGRPSRGGSSKGSRRRSKRDGSGGAGARLVRRRSSRDSATTITSTDSSTTIADSPVEGLSAALDDFPIPNRMSGVPADKVNLSPVAESPVRYPEIPRSQSSNWRRSIIGQGSNAPARPPLVRMKNHTPAGVLRDGATLVAVDSRPRVVTPPSAARPSRGQISGSAQRKGSNPHPDRNPGAVRSGSPDILPGEPASLSVPKKRGGAATDRASLPSQSRPHGPTSVYDAYNDPSGQQPLPVHPALRTYPTPPWEQQQQQAPYLSPPSWGMFSPPRAFAPAPLSAAGMHYGGAVTPPDSRYTSSDGSVMNSGVGSGLPATQSAAGWQTEGRSQGQDQGKRPRQNQDGVRQLTPKKKGEDLYLSVG